MFNLMTYYKFWSPTKTTSFWVLSEDVQVLFVVSLYMYCRWRSDRLSRRESCDPIKRAYIFFSTCPQQGPGKPVKTGSRDQILPKVFPIVYVSLSKILGRCTRYNIM